MTNFQKSPISRRRFMAAASAGALGTLLSACAPPAAPAAAPAKEQPKEQPASNAPVEIRVHMVKKDDVSDWIQAGLDQDIDGFKQKNPNIKVTLETIPGWTAEYNPKILSFAAAGTLGDAVWYPPRHRSHIAWGEQYKIVTDIVPLAQTANYDLNANFFPGANKANSYQGKQYWLSYISEPIVPIIVYNKTKIKAMSLQEPTDDMSYDDLDTWAKASTKDGVFGYDHGHRGFEPFGGGPYLRQHGVEPVDADGKKITLLDNRKGFVQALQRDSDLINKLKVSPSPSAGAVNQTELFGGQKLLAMDVWPFIITVWPASFKDFEMDFVLTPMGSKSDKRRTMLNEHVFGITTASKNTDAAFKFLTWIGGKEMNVQALVQGKKGPIARADVWADDRIYAKVPTYKKLRPLMEAIEPDFVVANFRGEEFDSAYSSVTDAMILGKIAPEQAADDIAKACQAVLDKDAA
jgi:ABC-type glycerol-3-phosphate transport system substrate-binding protein